MMTRGEKNDLIGKLASFGAWCLREHRQDFGDLDGASLQDKAEQIGLLVRVPVSEPCGEDCHCAEYYGEFPTECLRSCKALAFLDE